jgi:hypothetical protein
MEEITQVTTEDGDRHYEIKRLNVETKKYKSVTTLLGYFKPKDALIQWKKNVGEEKAKEITFAASSRGNKIHSYIESYFKQQVLPSLTEDDNNICFHKLVPILELIKPILIEEKLFWESDNYGFGGSVDICGTINTKNFKLRNGNELPENINFVGDWKTWNKAKYPKARSKDGSNYYPLISYYLQLAAYSAAINQRTNTEYKLNQCFIFGVTNNCKQPFIYYLDKDSVNFYWSKMKEIVYCYYSNSYFDWKKMEAEADIYNFLGERVDLV